MKKSFFFTALLFCLFFQLTVAQNGHQITLTLPPGHTYAQAISEAMQSADPGRIPYGALYERVVGWANLTECGNNRTSLDPRQPIDAPHDNYTLHIKSNCGAWAACC